MVYKCKYFKLHELVCPDVFNKYGERAWEFFEPQLLWTIDFIRHNIGKPMTVNNWKNGGQFSQRGLRCNMCQIPRDKTKAGVVYMSSHNLGKAVDFDVKGMKASEVREWLKLNKEHLPFNICVEDGVNWVHIDLRDKDQKIYLFKP